MIKVLLLLLSTVTTILCGGRNEVEEQGNFPKKTYNEYYFCSKDDDCVQVCRRHRVEDGFCTDNKCFCKKLAAESIYYRDERLHQCVADFYDYNPKLKKLYEGYYVSYPKVPKKSQSIYLWEISIP
uniref:Neurotoxin LmNaTx20 n=1 Tax=Lychas mucronatus TaxID=172552 RepID=A0A0U1SRW4_LYCMC|nr:neurotoxin LmNaTx20 precursor [Lychas mucronatus]